MARSFFAMRRDTHDRIFVAFLFGEKRRYAALSRPGHSGDESPVDLACRARPKSFCQLRRSKPCLRDQQTPSRILVQSVHQSRTLTVGTAQSAEHAVDMAHCAGAALNREPYRLIEHQYVGILVECD